MLLHIINRAAAGSPGVSDLRSKIRHALYEAQLLIDQASPPPLHAIKPSDSSAAIKEGVPTSSCLLTKPREPLTPIGIRIVVPLVRGHHVHAFDTHKCFLPSFPRAALPTSLQYQDHTPTCCTQHAPARAARLHKGPRSRRQFSAAAIAPRCSCIRLHTPSGVADNVALSSHSKLIHQCMTILQLHNACHNSRRNHHACSHRSGSTT